MTGAFKFLSKGEVVLIHFQRDGSPAGVPIVIKQRFDDRVRVADGRDHELLQSLKNVPVDGNLDLVGRV